MDRFVDFIHSKGRVILVLVVLLNLASLVSLFRISIETHVTEFFVEDNEVYAEYEALTEKYNIAGSIAILIEDDESLLSEENLISILDLQLMAKQLAGVREAQGFLPNEVVLANHSFDVDESFVHKHYDDLEDYIRERYIPATEFLSSDESTAIIALTLEDGADADALVDMLKAILARYDNLTLSLTGDAVIADTLYWYLIRILFILPPAAASLVLLVFYLMLRSRRLAVLSILPAGLAALWTVGTIFAQGESVNIVTAVSPIFIVVMGSAYGLHYVTHFMAKAGQHRDRRELTAETMKMVAKPIVLTALTTIAGFASLLWSDLVPTRQMGMYVPLGIAYAAFLSLVFLPVLLTRIQLPTDRDLPEQGSVIGLFVNLPNHRRAIIAAAIVVLALSAYNLPDLKVVSDPLLFFKEDSSIRQTFNTVEDTFGGALLLMGEIPAERGLKTLRDHEYAEDVLQMERDLERVPGILKAQSLFDTVQGASAGMSGQPGYPQSPNTVSLILQRIDDGDIESWYSDDGLRLVARTNDLTSEDVALLKEFQTQHPELRILSGTPILYDELNRLIVDSQVKSLGLALLLVFLMLVIFLRELRASIIALLPIAITIVAIMGALALTGYNLNLVTATLSAVAVGVGVDYAIHLISGIQYFSRQGMQVHQAVEAALSTVSKPILANAFGLATGVSVMFFSPLHIHTQIATVLWVAMTVSSLGALTIIPLFYTARARVEASKLDSS